MPAVACNALPGWYCPPLSPHPTVCPENWYCPGGVVMAEKCPDGRWSAVNSAFLEDCVEHYNVEVTVVVLLFFLLIVLITCIWLAAWDWEDRTRKDVQYTNLPPYRNYKTAHIAIHRPNYGSTVRDGKMYSVQILEHPRDSI
jgi:hypothetical protein